MAGTQAAPRDTVHTVRVSAPQERPR